MYEFLRTEMSIEKLIAVEVEHCEMSFGCLLVSKEHGNIFYSGDSRVCMNLINYCHGARVLIHEATLEEGMEEEAYGNYHTTSG